MWAGQASVSPLDLTLSKIHWRVWKQERLPSEEDGSGWLFCAQQTAEREGGCRERLAGRDGHEFSQDRMMAWPGMVAERWQEGRDSGHVFILPTNLLNWIRV